MDIGLTYSAKDPRQARARDFLREFIRETGVYARLIETEKDVTSPTVVIDGQTLKDLRSQPRTDTSGMFPGIPDIAQFLERSLWCV